MKKFFLWIGLPLAMLVGSILLILAALHAQSAPPPIAAKLPAAPIVDPIREGRDAIDARRYEEAFGILSTVGPGHPEYARAQRYIGWELFGDAMDRPEVGLPYVYRAWKHQRTGNEWQDLSRTYGAMLANMF